MTSGQARLSRSGARPNEQALGTNSHCVEGGARHLPVSFVSQRRLWQWSPVVHASPFCLRNTHRLLALQNDVDMLQMFVPSQVSPSATNPMQVPGGTSSSS